MILEDTQIKEKAAPEKKEKFKPGLYPGISNFTYHNEKPWTDFLSSHQIGSLLKSAAHYKTAKENPLTPTPAMQFGSAAHEYILEEVKPIIVDGTRYTNAFKETVADNPDKNVVTPDEFEKILRMKDALFKHDLARQLLRGGGAEESVHWMHDRYDGIKCKARPDLLLFDQKWIIDYKTTSDAHPSKFPKSIIDFNYDIQSVWYKEGMKAVTGDEWQFMIIAQEKDIPDAIQVYDLRHYAEMGTKKVNKSLKRLWDALNSRKWPGYPARLIIPWPPKWAMDNVEQYA